MRQTFAAPLGTIRTTPHSHCEGTKGVRGNLNATTIITLGNHNNTVTPATRSETKSPARKAGDHGKEATNESASLPPTYPAKNQGGNDARTHPQNARGEYGADSSCRRSGTRSTRTAVA